MQHLQPKVFISPGLSGNPDSPKLQLLHEVARSKGLEAEVFDCTQVPNPEVRVRRLLESGAWDPVRPILAGSSMGGYVSTVAAQAREVTGLFLLSPVLYLPPYEKLDPQPKAGHISVVHGWQDQMVPPESICAFAVKFGAALHLLQAGHSLEECLPEIRILFGLFLDRCLQDGN